MAHKHVQKTRRPIPRDGVGWRTELRGVLKFLNTKFEARDGTSGHWHRNISEYYLDRAVDLVKAAPWHLRGTPELIEFRRQVAECQRRFTSQAG